MDSDRHRERLRSLPAELASQCKHIADDLREQNARVRHDKVLAARVRMCSGYYDSEKVLSTIAARLLAEGIAPTDSSLAG